MNRVQENDISQINFMKYNMQKFAHILGKVGEDLCEQSTTIHDASQMINSQTDIKIFIEHNKSTNLVVNKEKFQDYQEGETKQSGLKLLQNTAERIPTTTFIIDENYMSANVLEEESKSGK